MTSLTTAQKRTLHQCPGCGHLLGSHDGAGCVPCGNDGLSCDTPAVIETTYAAVAALLGEQAAEINRAVTGE